MGRMGRWFRGLLGGNKPGSEWKKKWGFAKYSFGRRHKGGSGSPVEERRGSSYREGGSSSSSPALIYVDAVDPNKHAIAVAAATAAVAEAAVAAAQAAAAVVRLTSSGRGRSASASTSVADQDWAAVKIQAAFRAYLARRALRTLKGLVRVQALARGHLVRKHGVGILRCMEAVLRLQARARDTRRRIQIKPPTTTNTTGTGTTKHEHRERTPATATPEKYDSPPGICNPSWWWNMDEKEKPAASSSVVQLLLEEEEDDDNNKSDINKIRLQIDRFDDNDPNNNNNNNYESAGLMISSCTSIADDKSTTSPLPLLSQLSSPVNIISTKHSSSTTSGKMMRRGHSQYCYNYQYLPNYMANTESSKAKLRSQSAPKQRLHHLHKSPSGKRLSSGPHLFAAGKACPGSGRLDTFGMPIHRDILGYGRDATTGGRRRR
ncbi:hypothetical protein H6P81_004580 [Aristolochia fimbriata]|uniref:DUF4005 domain-containing protein n=1 Tax=Aristolochia fimbriata TaxID=158543 RepID=A0AAV7EV27_ARIFI|nr:hypothetical protein H6P81_004580 [Aristolochia fimbriata]